VSVPNNLRYLYRHLLENGFITSIDSSDADLFNIYSREILKQIATKGSNEWQQALPQAVTEEIIKRKLFGYKD
jgi:hypothetical protein